jgi:hypothetical protein
MWTLIGNIKGPSGVDGVDGVDGINGIDGATWRNGDALPADSLGSDGDFYLHDPSGDVYIKTAGSYGVTANIQGPPGADGTGTGGGGSTPVTDGALLDGSETATLVAGKDSSQHSQILSTDSDGKLQVSDGASSLTVDSDQLPAALSNGRLNTNLGSWIGSTAPTISQKVMAASIPVVVASDQSTLKIQGDPAGEPIRVSVPSVSDPNNSTQTPLLGGQTFTGTGVYVRDYASINVHCYANVASATDGLKFQWSPDNVFWDETLSFTVPASAGVTYNIGPRSDYWRLTYLNGSSAQGTFRIQTTLSYSVIRTGTVRLSDQVNPELDAMVVKSSITGKSTAGGSGVGSFVDVKVSPSGAVQVSGSVDVGNLPAVQPISAASLPLPAGAATEATLGTRLTEATFTTRVPTLGTKTAANSSPVVLASDQSPVAVTGSVVANLGTTAGLALDATLTGGTAKAVARGGAKGSTTPADITSSASGVNRQLLDVAIYDAAGTQITSFGGGSGGAGTQYADGTARGTATGTLLMVDDGTNIQSASGDTQGRQNVNSRITDGVGIAAVKGAASSASTSDNALVVAISPNNIVPVQIVPSPGAFTAGTGIVSASTSAVTILSANGLRRFATIYNDSTAVMYLVFGPGASLTNYTLQMAPGGFYEVPVGLATMSFSAIWASAVGAARVTSIT